MLEIVGDVESMLLKMRTRTNGTVFDVLLCALGFRVLKDGRRIGPSSPMASDGILHAVLCIAVSNTAC